MTLPILCIGARLPERAGASGSDRPDWVQANPGFIDRALARALARRAGGWVVVDQSSAVGAQPRRYTLAGRDFVAFRSTKSGPVHLAPDACPHMGAPLSCGRVEEGHLVCPWHGLRLGPEGRGPWRAVPTFDDGLLLWARVLDEEVLTDAPVIPKRPDPGVSAVIRMEGRCEPEDVVANRLDPWHGAHFHPHSFARLRMLSVDEDVLALRVAFRIAGPLCVEVDCTFHSPEPRTVVMTITDGDGTGSVVETHATPLAEGRTAMIEATVATSNRRGFALARRLGPLMRPFMERRASRLWVEDMAYAERRYALRKGEVHTGARAHPRGAAMPRGGTDRTGSDSRPQRAKSWSAAE